MQAPPPGAATASPRRARRLLKRSRYEIAVVLYSMAATVVLATAGAVANSALAFRSMLSAMVQVLGILTGFMAAGYVFWTKALIEDFREQANVLRPVFDGMKVAGATKVTYKSPLGLVRTEVERDISKPYAPAWFHEKVAPRASDDWRVMVDGYQELQNRMLRRAYLWAFTTIIVLGAVMTGYVLALGATEAIIAQAPWAPNAAVLIFSLALAWISTLVRLFLRPGGGVIVMSTKLQPDGSYTLIAPD